MNGAMELLKRSWQRLRRLWPQSIIWRVFLLLGLGLVVSHGLSVLIYSRDRIESDLLLNSEHVLERSANLVNLFEQINPQLRPQLLAAWQQPEYNLKLSSIPLVSAQGRGNDRRAPFLLNYLSQLLDDDKQIILYLRKRDVHHLAHDDDDDDHHDRRSDRRGPGHNRFNYSMALSVQLNDGRWLNIDSALRQPRELFSRQSLWSLLAMSLIVLLLIIWLLRLLLKPLQAFAKAATELGRDYRAAPMRVQGPAEVQKAIVAFNDMQARLRQLIENRIKMLAAVSHDLRTPITSLRLRTELIDNAEQRRKSLATLDHMEKMIESILTFAKAELATEQRRPVDLSALVESICNDHQDMGATAEFHGASNIKYQCAPLAMRRALTNLIDNAIKYGGCARVQINKVSSKIILTIDDDGPGIPADKQQEVFQPFARLSRERALDSGGGLGLSIAQTIIQAHGGNIKLENRPTAGLRLTVELPV